MKRLVSFLIIAGACGYFGHRYWESLQPKVDAVIQPVLAAVRGQPKATPAPAFPPGELPPEVPRTGRRAAPGFLYMLDRVVMNTDNGVIALTPGDEVRIMQRKPNGRIRITTGRYDFEVRASQVTNDYDLAQAARAKARPAATRPR